MAEPSFQGIAPGRTDDVMITPDAPPELLFGPETGIAPDGLGAEFLAAMAAVGELA